MKVEFHPQFHSDVLDSADYYDQQKPGLGDEFTQEIWRTVQKIKSNPKLGSIRQGTIRGLRIKRFKAYSIRYRIIGKTGKIRILGAFHGARHPAFGKDRS